MKITKKLNLPLIILLTYTNLYSQNFSDFEKIENKKIDSIIEKNNEKMNYKYYSFLPSVSYDALNNTFNVGVNFSNISRYFQEKTRNKIETEKLKMQLLQELKNEIKEFEKNYIEIITEIEILKIDFDLLENKKNTFFIKKSQYENNKINLEDYINSENMYISFLKNIAKNIFSISNNIIFFQKKTYNSENLKLEFEFLKQKKLLITQELKFL